MDENDSHETPLHSAIKAFRIRRTDIVRAAKRLAPQLGVEPISRNHLSRLERGQGDAGQSRILIVVAALRDITGIAFRAGDLFRLEPAEATSGGPGAWRASELADGRNLSVPVFSRGGSMSRIWRVFVPEETGSSPEQSFERLYAEYGALLRGVAMRRYGIPPDDAQEIVHDAFMAYLQRHTYIREARGWLYGTLRHHCIDYLRARGREIPLEAAHDPADERPEIERDRLIRQLTFSAVIASLGPRCRETLRRRFFKGEDRHELAESLSTTPGNADQLVSTCWRRAAEKFRSLALKAR